VIGLYYKIKMENEIINWSKVSELLAGNRDSIRANRYPKKFHKQIEFLKRWEQYLIEEVKNM